MPDRKNTYRNYWAIGAVLSFAAYFSGLAFIYSAVRKKILHRSRAIILTYHRIRDDDKDPDITVAVQNFEKQIQYLRKNFLILSLKELIERMQASLPFEEDCAVITFDDGYKDNYQNAFPVLMKNDLPATIFLISSLIGKDPEKLSLDKIREMSKHNISWGSHTVTHPVLSEITIDEAGSEIERSKKILEELLKQNIDFFAYPVGKKRHFNEAVKDAVKRCGYKAALTTENGAAEMSKDLFEVKRIGIRDCPLYVFKVRVSGLFESRPVLFLRQILKLT